MSNYNFQIVNGNIVTPKGIIEDGAVTVENGVITYIGSTAGIPQDSAELETVDAAGKYILPGFIDVHVHGGMLEDFSKPSKAGIDAITKLHASQGTTTMLATTMTMPKDVLDEVLAEVQSYMENDMPYAQLGGVHLEGPFISPKWPGAQNPAHIVPPNKDWIEQWEEQYP